MNLRLVLAWLHLLALAIGMGGLWGRARSLHDSLRDPEKPGAIRRAMAGDAWWGIAALLWIVTGVWRLVGATEKNPGYYFSNRAFMLKMALFLGVFALEIWPMTTLIRWRMHRREPNTRDAGRIEVISYVQCVMLLAIVFAAVSMARGYGVPSTAAPGVATAPVESPSDSVAPPGARQDSTPRTLIESPVAPAIAASGSEITTEADLALLVAEIAMPLAGIDPMKLKSSFDERRGGGTRPHEALDIMAPRGTPIRSATKGRVLRLFNSRAGGLMVYAADSSERFILMYGHMDAYAPGLKDGARLERGQIIGTVGSTGNASAASPHLHIAVARSANVKDWSKGTPIDPLPVLQAAAARK